MTLRTLPVRVFLLLGQGMSMPLRLLVQYRHLFFLLLRRDLVDRTSGTVLGFVWLLAQPAMMMVAYWFLLGLVLKVRMPGEVAFVPYFLTGMLPWLMISDALGRATGVLSEMAALYQRMNFPIALLPLLPLVLSALIYGVVFIGVTAVVAPWQHMLYVPPLLVLLVIWLMPFAYLLSVFGLFIRDVRQIIPLALMMVMFLSPILYMPQMLPARLQPWMVLNPVADWLAVVHGLIQGLPFDAVHVLRPWLWWLLLAGPAWLLFRRAEPHMREAL